MPAELPPATLRLHVDRQALADNWRVLDRLSGPSAATGAAVKANGYGLGIDNVMPALVEAGARDFFVAHWRELPPVLKHVPAGRIGVLHGVTNEQEVAFAIATGARPVINSLRQAQLWTAMGGGACDLMIDTGINRLGVPLAEIGDQAIAALEVDVLMSHLASADEDSALNARQLARFQEVASVVPARRRSLANSAGIAIGTAYAFDLTRPGLALYGGIARTELAGSISQVAFPEAAVLQRRLIQAGETVGYNAKFTARRVTELATVSIGYADGFLRCRGRDTALQHKGRELPIVGRVSMDMVVVDCSADPTLKEGDFLSIPFDLPRIAATSGLSQYELLTTIGTRFQTV